MLYVAMMLLWLPWHFLSCAVGNHGHAPQMCDGVRPTTSLGSPCIQNMLFRFWTSDIMILDIFHVLSCAFMHCRILSKTQLSLPKGLRPATSVNGSSFAAFPCASPLIRWRSWSVRIFCGSCTAVFQHESKNLDQIDSHLEIYNDTYYIYSIYIYSRFMYILTILTWKVRVWKETPLHCQPFVAQTLLQNCRISCNRWWREAA